jgi:chemotaxis protein CheD
MASGTAIEPGTCTTVGMGRVAVARAPGLLISILGSCIGVAMYQPRFQIGALAHVVLPKAMGVNGPPGKFANTAIPQMIEEIEKAGGSRAGLVAKLAGGACMFGQGGPLQIGRANADAINEALQRAGVKIVAADIGGSKGRRVTFDTASGELNIKVIGAPQRVI